MNKISTSGFLKSPDFIFYFVKYIGQRASYTRTLINLLICVGVRVQEKTSDSTGFFDRSSISVILLNFPKKDHLMYNSCGIGCYNGWVGTPSAFEIIEFPNFLQLGCLNPPVCFHSYVFTQLKFLLMIVREKHNTWPQTLLD